MAYQFSANQYEQAYKPPVLRNWEVPKYYDEKLIKRIGNTKIISNDKGHLLPGVPKLPNSPWGDYVGTWNLPRYIDRATANKLSGLDNFNKWNKQKDVTIKTTRTCERKPPTPKKVVATEAPKAPETPQNDSPATDEVKPEPENSSFPYVPGDFTDEKYKLPSHDSLASHRFSTGEFRAAGYPKSRNDFSQPLPKIAPATIPRDEVDKMYEQSKEMREMCPTHAPKPAHKTPSALISAIKNFQLAKHLHKANLAHDPLPDTVASRQFCRLQMEGGEAGLALPDEACATGVGWRGHPGHGPTRCTKLKVYRPKTGAAPPPQPRDGGRPSSVTSFDRQWRFIRQRKVTPIELAICWDLTPENADDEPKRTARIDGSNGSLAPAVFSLVHTPKDEGEVGEGNVGAVFGRGPGCEPKSEDECSQCSSGGRAVEKAVLPKARLCMACELRNVTLNDDRKRGRNDEYKMAFKAGVPQKVCNKDKRQDYPEHWRLATVYQHSYKPIRTRKRPLLHTVFK